MVRLQTLILGGMYCEFVQAARYSSGTIKCSILCVETVGTYLSGGEQKPPPSVGRHILPLHLQCRAQCVAIDARRGIYYAVAF